MSGRGRDFCAGVELAASRGQGRAESWEAGITRGYECWKPIIASLQGNVLGGGLELALCADIRVGDPSRRLGSPEVKWGLMQGCRRNPTPAPVRALRGGAGDADDRRGDRR